MAYQQGSLKKVKKKESRFDGPVVEPFTRAGSEFTETCPAVIVRWWVMRYVPRWDLPRASQPAMISEQEHKVVCGILELITVMNGRIRALAGCRHCQPF
jgi:hypothetical protein